MVVTCSGKNFVAATQHVLPHYLCRYVRVAGLGQVAVCCFANEAAFTLWIEPAGCLTIGNDRGEWRALILLTARTALLLLLATAATTTTTAALSAASALIASTTSVVTVIAIAMLTAPALVALLLSLATTAAALRLRIVLGLLL
jgi:hypothetical protein